MTVYWTRARHAELGDTVLPAAAVESYPDWEAVGEPSDNQDALYAEIAHEKAIAAADAESAAVAEALKPAPSTPTPSAPKSGADTAESSAPAGADPKE